MKLNNKEDLFAYNKLCFWIIGMAYWKESFKYRIFTTISITATILFYIFATWDLYLCIFVKKSVALAMANLTSYLAHVLAVYRYTVLIRKITELEKLLNFLNEKSFQPHKSYTQIIRNKWISKNTFMILLTIALGIFSLMFWVISPFFDSAKSGEYNFAQPSYIPIDFHQHPHLFYISYIFIFFAICISSSVYMSTSLFFLSLILFLSSEFEILSESFSRVIFETKKNVKLVKNENEFIYSLRDVLKKVIQRHVLLLE